MLEKIGKKGWSVAAVLALLFGFAGAAGYQAAPLVVAAAQNRVRPAEAAPLPRATPEAPAAGAVVKQKVWLGVQIVAGDGGVRVEQVVPNSPAAAAGLQKGDVITAVNGKAVSTPSELSEQVAAMKPGDKVSLSVQRDGSAQTIEATLATMAGHGKNLPKVRPGGHGVLPFANPLGALGSLLPELRDIPADQRFEHQRGGSFSFTDKDGKAVTLNITLGLVTAVTSDTITLRPNGATVDATYRVTANTRTVPRAADFAANVKANDKVAVVSKDGSDEALAVVAQYTAGKRPGAPQPKWNLRPDSGRGSFNIVPPGPLGDRLRSHLGALGKRLDEIEQRLNEQGGPKS